MNRTATPLTSLFAAANIRVHAIVVSLNTFFLFPFLFLLLAGFFASTSVAQSGNKKSTKPAKSTESSTTITRSPEEIAKEKAKLEAEMALADSAKPYLVLDLERRMLLIKLGGAVVWEHLLELADADEKKIKDFMVSLENPEQHYVRYIKEKHLFSGKEQTPDSVLSIVGEALKIDKALIQRQIPERFQLEFDDGFVMEFRSAVKGKETSKFKNTVLSVKNVFNQLFGEVFLVTTIDSIASITLYRMAEPGVPLILAQ